jgi:Flp pilus assembly protein TadG
MKDRKGQSQSGQAIVIVGAMLIALTILGTMVFDVGLSMSDRRNMQAYADAAALAGARSYGPAGPDRAHWVALQYLAPTLGFSAHRRLRWPCEPPAHVPVPGFNIQLVTRFASTGSTTTRAFDAAAAPPQPASSRAWSVPTAQDRRVARASTPGPQYDGATSAVAGVSGDANINGAGAGFQTVTGPVYAYGSFGANNGPHATGVPPAQLDYNGQPCSPSVPNYLDNGGGPNGLNYVTTDGSTLQNTTGKPWNDIFSNASPISAGPVYLSPAAAQDALGNWKPGIYNGFAPSGGTMNGGVYKIINSPSLNLGSITNTVHTLSGTSNGANAVAIVIDSSDTGTLNISSAVLNGLDDLYGSGYIGQRDPAGTHNFLIYGGSGPTAYTAGVSIGPGATTDMSGIIYLPKSPYVGDGNSSPQFTGSFIVASMTVRGGGNGMQVFHWVCNLTAVAGQPYSGGLLR